MAQLGADDVQVDQLAVTFDNAGRSMLTAESTITSLVRSLVWIGPDADVFRSSWNSTMRAQLTNVGDRLTTLAKDLRAQAEAQRSASVADGGAIPPAPGSAAAWFEERRQELAEWYRERAAAARRFAAATTWAEDVGREQIRDIADGTGAEQLAWWKGLTDDQRAALLRTDPGALSGLEGLPKAVIEQARNDFVDSARPELEISSTEDKIEGELNVAWVHLGVEGSAGIVQQADGTFRVDLDLDGEIGANVGSKNAQGHVGLGAGVSQSYEFDSQADAEAFVSGLYDKLTPDADWSVFAGPGAVMAETVDDVVGYLGDHGDQRTSFQGELRVEGEANLELGAFEVKVSGEAGGRYDFDTKESELFVGGSASGSIDVPSAGDGTIGSASLSADLEVALKFDDRGTISSLDLGGTFSGEASVGIEEFLNGTNAGSKTPETLSLSAAGGADVRFDASIDLQDPLVQQRAAALLNGMNSGGGVSLTDLQALLQESDVQVQIDAVSSSSDEIDFGVGSITTSTTASQNAFTWVKPAGGDFIYVSGDELRKGRSRV